MVGQRGVRRWSARWYLVPLLLADEGGPAPCSLVDCPAESRTLFAAHRVAYLEAGLAGLAALGLCLCALTSWAVVPFARNRSGARR